MVVLSVGAVLQTQDFSFEWNESARGENTTFQNITEDSITSDSGKISSFALMNSIDHYQKYNTFYLIFLEKLFTFTKTISQQTQLQIHN